MHPPCEMMVESFLPGMRMMVARRLNEEGFSQGRIASMLGVTQASVSLYLSAPAKRQARALASLGVTEEEADRYAALLAEDLKKNPVYAVATLYSIWNSVLGAGRACGAHREANPFLATCDVCMKVFGPAEARSERAIGHVQGATRLIEGSSLFVRVMPEVSVNLAYAEGEARSAEDVVAIPGRIVKVRGQSRSFMRPEYGASTHLAGVLLEVRKRVPRFHAAMNLRYDERMDVVLKKTRAVVLYIGEPYPQGEDKVVGALRAKVGGSPEFDSVVDRGGAGLEPSLYIFAEDAEAVVRRALALAREYVDALAS